ncbi:MAG TPA: SAM-dependent chlorinase/fluorinase [Acidobacteriota bacterium]|nr:SAM-dependent chlorinase/fluorinase [Acidobacteriota bacterium]
MPRIITLLTDFGLRDHYVSAMKGVILSKLPEASLVDISHQIEPHDVVEAAWVLEGCRGEFPPGTVHLAVVDPGVGSQRKAIALSAAGHYFVGPDNGIFTLVLENEGSTQAREIHEESLISSDPSAVFHGRDIFAPAAAALAGGFDFSNIGAAVASPVRLALPEAVAGTALVSGEVMHVDRFGNLVTNIKPSLLVNAGIEPRAMTAEVAGRRIETFVEHYASAPPGETVLLTGSRGLLEIALRDGSAARVLTAGRGAKVVIRKAG